MSLYPLSQNEPTKYGVANERDFPLTTYIPEAFFGGRSGSATVAAFDTLYDVSDSMGDSPTLTPEELQQKYPAPGLEWTVPTKENIAIGRFARQQKLLRNAYYSEGVDRWAGGLLPSPSVKSVLGFGAEMAGTLTMPLDLALMFVPFAGEGSVAEGAALRRTLLKDAWIPLADRFPTMAPRMANNLAQGMALAAPGVVRDFLETGDVDISETAKNVIGGAIVAEGFHHLGTVFEKLKTSTYNRLLAKAIDDHLADRPVDVSGPLMQDRGIVEAAVREANPDMPESEIQKLTDKTVKDIASEAAKQESQKAKEALQPQKTETGLAPADDKVSTPEKAQEKIFGRSIHDEDIAKVEKDIKDLEASSPLSKEEQAALQAELDEEQYGTKPTKPAAGGATEEPKIPQHKTIDQNAQDLIKSVGKCIMRNL